MRSANGDLANARMVDRLIGQGALWSSDLIAAFRATPRHRFLDRVYVFQEDRGWREVLIRPQPSTSDLKLVYADRALITRVSGAAADGFVTPISSSSQPSLMAQMLEDLHLAPGLRVLDIGAGTGYNAALAAHVAGKGRIVSIDVDRRVLSEAQKHLQAFSERGVVFRHADGRAGLAEQAPWDRIIVTAATPDLEPAWIEQLAEGGILLAPLAFAPGLAFVVRAVVSGGALEGRLTRAAYFMPLRSEQEAGDRPEAGIPIAGQLRAIEPPWAGWGDPKRFRNIVSPLLQALAFYGHLRGLRVSYQTLPGGQAAYGLQDTATQATCWLGMQKWNAEDEMGAELGRNHWRAFLEAGAPRPTEFRVRISLTEILPAGQARESYVVHGPLCRQIWDLVEPRERPVF
ncbi:MAG: protein-L-isoaspartate O-methyltransferase family protein [Gemmataceae bacterium]